MCRETDSECVCVSVCTCTCACKELLGRREAHSYLDEWLAQSLLVNFQHNVPDVFIRQAERAQENCCRDEGRRESFLLLFYKVRQRSSLLRQKVLLWRDTQKSSYLLSAFTRTGCLKCEMMLVWPLTFAFTVSKREKTVKIKDVKLLKWPHLPF